ncbi:MAG TPA: tetratricopeptide repeat protein, partial [Candidatus Binatia bacterium]|nr:tetratricopeptide repeat protein [Candidatus Binatia bacterium]
MPAAVAGLALVLLTLVAYLPALRGGFVWDDDAYVTANRALRTAGGLARIWLEPGAVPQYYPLTFTTFWAEYRLWGASPAGYHATNVLLHGLGAVLLWRVLLCLAVPGAWLAAALFAVHPVHVESVAWITERKNVLAGVLYLGAALAYLRAASPTGSPLVRPRLYAAALALFAGALLAKTVACSLPVALGLVLWWKRGRLGRRELAPLVPFLVLGLALALVTVWVERHHVGARGVHWDLSLVERTLVAGRALWFYAAKLVFPVRLTFVYPRWRIDAGAPAHYLFPLAAIAAVALLWGARRRLGTGPLVAIAFFAATLVPALGFFDVYPMRYSFVADHFQYHASMGPLALAAALFATGVRVPAARAAVAGGVLALLAVLTWRQAGAYRDAATLWEDTLAKNPGAAMAHVNLGMLRHGEGRAEEAATHFRAALALDPTDAEVHTDLGMALAAAGRTDDALAAFAEALRLDPRDARTHNNRANTLAAQGRTADSIAAYEDAIRLDPRYADAHGNLANVLALAGRTDEAIVHYGDALRLDPEYVEAHHNLGVLLAERGLPADALAHQLAALSLDPDSSAAHYDAANALVALGRTRDASVHYRAALRTKPDWPEALGRL